MTLFLINKYHSLIVHREGIAIDGSEILLGHTTGTSYDVSGTGHGFYLVTATDFGGNEGEAAVLENDVSAVEETAPIRIALVGNHPNPFNPRTTIAFELPQAQTISLRIYDLAGRLVATPLEGDLIGAGRHEIGWQGRDSQGREVPAGIYLYRLEAEGYVETKRMVLVK